MKVRHCCQFVGVVCMIGLMALIGCRKDKDKGPATPDMAKAGDNPQVIASAGANPEVIAKLAKADLLDGTEDDVVHRCAGCRFGMDGDEKNAVTVGKYQMHFCSAGCRDRFAKDVTGNTLALVIPDSD